MVLSLSPGHFTALFQFAVSRKRPLPFQISVRAALSTRLSGFDGRPVLQCAVWSGPILLAQGRPILSIGESGPRHRLSFLARMRLAARAGALPGRICPVSDIFSQHTSCGSPDLVYSFIRGVLHQIPTPIIGPAILSGFPQLIAHPVRSTCETPERQLFWQ